MLQSHYENLFLWASTMHVRFDTFAGAPSLQFGTYSFFIFFVQPESTTSEITGKQKPQIRRTIAPGSLPLIFLLRSSREIFFAQNSNDICQPASSCVFIFVFYLFQCEAFLLLHLVVSIGFFIFINYLFSLMKLNLFC